MGFIAELLAFMEVRKKIRLLPILIIQLQTGFLEHIVHSIARIACIVLPAAEALLLSGSDDVTIDDERGGAVMIVGRYPENSRHARRAYK